MNAPIKITATVAAWVPKYAHRDLLEYVEQGNTERAVSRTTLYGSPDMDKFSDYIRVGEAEVTLHLLPRDQQTKAIVKALQAQLAEERVKWHDRQEAILAEISKWQAIEYTPAEEARTVEA